MSRVWSLPPLWVRRVVLAPLIVLLAFVWMPVALWLGIVAAGVVAWALPGKLRILRVVFMVGLYLLWDALALVWMFILWVASGFGWAIHRDWFQRRHFRLMAAMLGSLFWAAKWLLRLEIVVDDADLQPAGPTVPTIVVSRHGGPADSFIIVNTLINRFNREPAIVMKDTLQWDPAIDVLLNRVPTRFVTTGRRRKGPGGALAIGELAAGLKDNDTLLIFPEGGNVTPRRRARRIEQLRAKGQADLAARSEAMQHVMAPHAGGLLAAIENAPQARIVMMGHTGLDQLETVGDIWQALPVDKRITLKMWTVPADEVPATLEEREVWLFDWWERIDRWIGENRTA
ncbi:1-acyl-sn-glycerol-3-phosphate acyltransferase [Demequina sp.]|uniref:1-acyl-sn-glycerol-3-phosphate acyltransferase n=1 Tax=Demequina sp. TaxID=2050685 RepID=UPI003D0A17FF